MRRIHASQLPAHLGRSVRLAGWVHRRRLLKSVAFLVVRDATGLGQAVVTDPAAREAVARLTEETVVEVVGTATGNPAAPGGVELTEPSLRVLGEPAVPPPFDLYRPTLNASLPTQLDHAALALRHPRRAAALRAGAAAVAGFRATLDGAGFVEVHTPKLVAAATESGADVFPVGYFGRSAYLAQSPQFYKQLLVGVFERVYEVGPAFRAEPHDTARHLAQFTSLDAELGFIDDHRDVMAVLRDVLAGMLGAVADRAAGSLATLGGSVPDVPAELPAVDFPQALAIAGADPGALDLDPAAERAVGQWAAREHGCDFVFVTGYPMAKRPFYTHPDPARPAYSNSFDLLFRGVELVTGGQRLHRYPDYRAALAAAGAPLDPYRPYVEAFRHGMPPHGGFAIGLERFVARLVGAGNVREVTAFPRDRNRLTP
ncbi:MAG: aspartate--tRNA(Asn) ligase [Micromonosporaceae bacterium]|nr:aspartate--tRNA(Asn) ligase [Micromonosporaceae bacterium]